MTITKLSRNSIAHWYILVKPVIQGCSSSPQTAPGPTLFITTPLHRPIWAGRYISSIVLTKGFILEPRLSTVTTSFYSFLYVCLLDNCFDCLFKHNAMLLFNRKQDVYCEDNWNKCGNYLLLWLICCAKTSIEDKTVVLVKGHLILMHKC